ncbi:MAG: PaaI family thioesterase [Nitrospirae bacterium]|nr:PaaI family thioesterase [Nitrospirota bacterium]MBI5695279.1 PaaI family thioesterase [Nitrospirota bacterium]
MQLKDDHHCFVCGRENPAGLRLVFELDREARSITTVFVPEKTHQGYEGVVHGGLISAVLDEAMTKLAFSLGMDAVTGRLTVRFKRPLMVGERMSVTGRLTKESGRAIEAEAVGVKDDGTVVAEAQGLLMRVL